MRIVDRFTTKLVVAALVVSAVPLGILGFYAYGRIAGSLEQSAVAMAVNRVSQAGRSIRSTQARVERDVLFLARLTALRASQGELASTEGAPSPGERRLDRYFASFIQDRPFCRGIRYLDSAGNEILRVDAEESAPSVSEQPGQESEGFTQTMALARNQVYVSPAFVERTPSGRPGEGNGSGSVLVRYGAPVVTGQGRPEGAVILTVAVDELLRQACEALSGDDVVSFIADEQGHYLHHTVEQLVWNAPVGAREAGAETASVLQRDFPTATEGLAETPVVKELGDGRVMVLAQVRAAGARQQAGAEPAGVGKWVVGQVYRRDVIFRPVVAFRWTFLLLLAVTTVIAALVAAGLAHHLTGPVRELQAGTRLIGSGALDHRIPVRSRDEFGELAASFNTMSEQLAEHLKHIQETTAARARTEGELRTAREIQQALLPRKLPPFPGMESLEVFGNNIPAYEVGGDFYDCQPVGEGRVMLALGDVSGKGVPAALLMTMTSTLLRTFALESRSPSDILIRTNRALLLRGDPRTFVTVFLAWYNLGDRRLVFANAGHTRPFLLRSAGRVTSLDGGDLPLGIEEVFQPEDVTVQLEVGDRLFLYSDGLTEARNVEGEPFGTRRLRDLLRNAVAPSARELYDEVVGAVMKHEAGAPQFDDVAVLVVKVK